MEPNADRDLRALFERQHDAIADEPFVSTTALRTAAEGRRGTVVRRVLLAGALLAIVGLSPWLVAGSLVMSAQLEALFARASMLLATPYGMAVAVLCAAAVLYVNRRLIF